MKAAFQLLASHLSAIPGHSMGRDWGDLALCLGALGLEKVLAVNTAVLRDGGMFWRESAGVICLSHTIVLPTTLR